jgi:hypothetical protein
MRIGEGRGCRAAPDNLQQVESTMNPIQYYFQAGPYPTIASRTLGNGATEASHLTLEGAIQNMLDGIHMILRSQAALAAFGGQLDGVWAQQASLADTLTQITALAGFWPRFYLDSVPAETTATAIAAKYKAEASALFAAYGAS